MYGLPQAAFLAQLQLITHLRFHGYHQTSTHYASAKYLHRTLSMLYEMKLDWSASKHIGTTLNFDATHRTITLSMPGYIEKVLTRFVPDLSHTPDTPAFYVPPIYGVQRLPPSKSCTKNPNSINSRLAAIFRSRCRPHHPPRCQYGRLAPS